MHIIFGAVLIICAIVVLFLLMVFGFILLFGEKEETQTSPIAIEVETRAVESEDQSQRKRDLDGDIYYDDLTEEEAGELWFDNKATISLRMAGELFAVSQGGRVSNERTFNALVSRGLLSPDGDLSVQGSYALKDIHEMFSKAA